MIRRILFAAAACASFPAILGPQPAHAAAPAPARVIQMDHLSAEVSGKGSPVILIPGLASPRSVWEAFVPELARTHRVYLVQVNGFAGEDPRGNLAPGILAGLVADLHALVARERLGAVPVVGHSMGGLTGLLWARTWPGDLAKLMVVDSLPFTGDIFMPNATVVALEPQAAAMRDQMIASYGKPDKAGAEQTAAFLALKPESRAKVVAWSMAADSRVSGRAMYEDLTTDLRADIAAIQTPITLVYPWSAQMPQARADAFYHGEYAKAPHIAFVPIGDAAHFVMLDQPQAFAAALAAFLAG